MSSSARPALTRRVHQPYGAAAHPAGPPHRRPQPVSDCWYGSRGRAALARHTSAVASIRDRARGVLRCHGGAQRGNGRSGWDSGEKGPVRCRVDRDLRGALAIRRETFAQPAPGQHRLISATSARLDPVATLQPPSWCPLRRRLLRPRSLPLQRSDARGVQPRSAGLLPVGRR
jgi:hypothetical protein